MVAGGRTHPAVAGDQRSIKEFGQRYVGSIIGGEIVAAARFWVAIASVDSG